MPDSSEFEVIDVLEYPHLAEEDKILADSDPSNISCPPPVGSSATYPAKRKCCWVWGFARILARLNNGGPS